MEEKAHLKISENETAYIPHPENLKNIPIEPFRTTCEYCGKSIVTCTKKEYNLLIFPYAIILFFFYGFLYGFILLSLTFLLFQNISHICPECYCEVVNKTFYPIKSDKGYYSITYGKCTLVIRKIIIHIILFLVLLFGIYLNLVSYLNYKRKRKSLEKDLLRNDEKMISNFYNETEGGEITWEELINDCGAKVMVENTARAIEIFNKKYLRRKVHWKGIFINAFIQRLSQLGLYDPNHLVNLNIRMIPSESLKSQDLVLSMGREKFLKYYSVISKIKSGSAIEFEAIFEDLGDEWRPHHFHLVNIAMADDYLKEMKDKVNVTLFKGIKFDIKGHVDFKEIKDEVDKINEEELNKGLNNSSNNNNFNIDDENNNISVNTTKNK